MLHNLIQNVLLSVDPKLKKDQFNGLEMAAERHTKFTGQVLMVIC